MDKIALIVGASGIIGSNLANELLANGWTTYGLARRPQTDLPGLHPIAADLLDPASLEAALADVAPTHVFLTSWMRNDTEAENIRVNGGMVRNLPPTPLREEQPRLDIDNFYYAQEDEVYAAAERDGFTWSIHRPHTIIGKAVGNLMNMGTTLAAYASICKETGRPFQWPGSQAQWEGLSDVTDARVIAKQLVWAATAETARNEAFNITNGDYFRWSWMWPRLAAWFGVEAAGFDGTVYPLEVTMAGDGRLWHDMATRYGLVEPDLSRLASPWHTDLDLGRPIEVMTDMSKSRKAGFHVHQRSDESFFELFAQLRTDRLIP
jgi:nucleoside-diphosphate-sugar epimerase